MSTNWSKDCLGRRYLIGEFKRFILSGGKTGINPELAEKLKPKQAKEEIFDKHQALQAYKRERFPENLKDTARAFAVDNLKGNARKQGDFFVCFLFSFYFMILSILTFVFLRISPS